MRCCRLRCCRLRCCRAAAVGCGPSGERFGRERMKALIRSHAGASAGQILASMVQALQAFTETSSLKDDITLVVIKLRNGDPISGGGRYFES